MHLPMPTQTRRSLLITELSPTPDLFRIDRNGGAESLSPAAQL